MKHKLIITKEEDRIISSLFEESEMLQVNVFRPQEENSLGNIYVGKVKNIVANIAAAFIEYEKGKMCYLSLEEVRSPIFLNSKKNEKLVVGDEILVQIAKADVKTKAPVAATGLNFTGKYLVLTHGNNMIGISGKIVNEEERRRLKNLMEAYKNADYGFIVRTNAANAEDSVLKEEAEALVSVYSETLNHARHKTPFSMVYRTLPGYLCDIRDGLSEAIAEIITDDRALYEEIAAYLGRYQKEDMDKLKFYEDNLLSLSKLYGINLKLENALKKKVWLKSGGTIIIEPTEALTVIDVNTGKAIYGKRKVQETFFKINLEAAEEIAMQIRLRNLSGIIIIDFIDMEDRGAREELMRFFEERLRKDPIKTVLVDMTALNLVEVTRKKVRKPLYEQIHEE
ncbi:ribonuclease E/G [Anaerocolumna xylanovorans]|uniref:Ribonuclease G n=1 Tax=Anaerocolumna xylanovorans DSM 12503 TaxID=1121345 RepID=A0A1M7Y1Q9_9FIRM|nr:ribonuclease E/G [Anaerocolumna xylanovorans]SHO45774.1 ribonuclease G [Anaerocolumna xylanovorans DSM 12503]